MPEVQPAVPPDTGRLLFEGVPGLAKTLSVKTIAQAITGDFKRIQFTPDLVPADLVGTRIYNQRAGDFQTSLGPVFTNLLLADEINRAPAKVQSALLEVMQERQVTIGRETHKVPDPFLVMATQNPIETEGTYALPEAQVDRFMLKVLVGYPSEMDEFVVVERVTGHPGHDDGPPAAAAARSRQRLRGPDAHGIRGPARVGDAAPFRVRHRRRREVHQLRGESPRVDQSRPRGPRARLPSRPPLRHRAGRSGSRARCPPTPDRSLIRGSLRGRIRGRRREARARAHSRTDRAAAGTCRPPRLSAGSSASSGPSSDAWTVCFRATTARSSRVRVSTSLTSASTYSGMTSGTSTERDRA